MKPTNSRNRALIIGMGGFFSGALVHSLLPPWNIWLCAILTCLTCLVISGVLAFAFSHQSGHTGE